MNLLKKYFMILLEWISLWLKNCLMRFWGAFPGVNSWTASPERRSCQADSEEWKTNEALRTYHLGDGGETMVTVQTSTHAFHVSKKWKINQKLAKGQRKLSLIIHFQGGPQKTFRVQWVLQSLVPIQHERDVREPHPPGLCVVLHLLQSSWILLL